MDSTLPGHGGSFPERKVHDGYLPRGSSPYPPLSSLAINTRPALLRHHGNQRDRATDEQHLKGTTLLTLVGKYRKSVPALAGTADSPERTRVAPIGHFTVGLVLNLLLPCILDPTTIFSRLTPRRITETCCSVPVVSPNKDSQGGHSCACCASPPKLNATEESFPPSGEGNPAGSSAAPTPAIVDVSPRPPPSAEEPSSFAAGAHATSVHSSSNAVAAIEASFRHVTRHVEFGAVCLWCSPVCWDVAVRRTPGPSAPPTIVGCTPSGWRQRSEEGGRDGWDVKG